MRQIVAVMLCVPPLAAQTTAAQHTAWAREFMRGRAGTPSAFQPAPVAHASAIRAMDGNSSLTSAWHAVGPMQVETAAYGKVTGRVTAIAFDPDDATGNTVYIGTTGGGVWKSTNVLADAASVRFAPLTDSVAAFAGTAPSLSIGALIVLPGNIILAGTGDTNDATDSYYGRGILRSTDGGTTWSLITGATGGFVFTGEGFSGFETSTLSPGLVVAAVSHSTEGTINGAAVKGKSVRGLYYSTDYGATWSMAYIWDGATAIQAPSYNFSNFEGNAATSIAWNAVRQRFYAAVRFHGYYESADGISWKRLANQPGAGLTAGNCPSLVNVAGSQSCPIFRGALAVQPVTGDTFAFTVNASNGNTGIFQDVCNRSGSACGNSTVQWTTQISSSALESNGAIAQGDYNLALAAVPWSGDTLLFAGTTEIFRCSLAAGCSFRNTTNATIGCTGGARVAPAQHAIAWSGTAMLFGNDGGVWRSVDGVAQASASCSADDASHFQNLNGGMGSLAEVHALASHPSDADTILAALGALGSASTTNASSLSSWTQIGTGESGAVAIDSVDPRNWYVQSGGGVAVVLCANGSACNPSDFAVPPSIAAAQTSGDQALPSAPFLLDPTLHTSMIVGTCRVWRGDARGGSLWSSSNAVSAMLAGPKGLLCDGSNALVRSLAAGGTAVAAPNTQNAGSPVLYAGMAGGLDGGLTYGGHVFATLAADAATSATVWADRGFNVTNDPANAGRFNPGNFDVASVYADPHDATGKTVYAAVMGFGYPHVYRSTDAGATWANVSSNLPNAPANAVIVDAADANTVYVATDAGVFATQAITTCASAGVSCWSTMGSGLPIAPVVALNMQAAIAARGSSQKGVLRAGTYGRGIWEIPLLTAGVLAQSAISASPQSLAFAAEQQTGTTSAAQTITITNTGTAPLLITSVDVTGDFSATNTCMSAMIGVNSTCSIAVTFAPTVIGARAGTITIAANTPSGSATISLSGTGARSFTPSISQTAIAFPDTRLNTTSTPSRLTITNNGNASGTLGVPVVTGDFAVSGNTCGATSAAGASCAVSVVFTPTTTGARNGSVTIAAGNTTLNVALSGNATNPFNPVLSETVVKFPDTRMRSTSTAIALVVANTGGASGSIGAPALSGSSDFAISANTCGATLAPNATCVVAVTFTPGSIGPQSGTLSLLTDAGALTATLSGNGYGLFVPFLSSKALVFADTPVDGTSPPVTVTVTNAGTISGGLGRLDVGKYFSAVANTCGATLDPGATCAFSLVFRPTALGTHTSGFTINSEIGPLEGTMTGNGTGSFVPTLAPSPLTFADTRVGTTSVALTLKIANTGALVGPLGAPAISGGDFSITSNTCGATLAGNTACAMTIAFTPTASGPRSASFSIPAGGVTMTAPVSGNGVSTTGFASVFTPSSLMFGSMPLNSTSAVQNITLANTGSTTGTLGAASITGDFNIVANTCGASLAPNTSCTLSVVFRPTASGTRSGTLTVSSDAGALTAALGGTGMSAATDTLSTTALTFANTQINSASPAQTISVRNDGGVPLTLINPVIVSGDFAVSNGCGTTLAAHSSCAMQVTFTPLSVGVIAGSLRISDALGTQSVSLAGTGFAPAGISLAPSALSFGYVGLGQSSAAQAITLTNNGGAPLAISNIGVTGDFGSASATNACTTGTMAVGASCQLAIAFIPQVAGSRSGAVSITSNATPGTQTVVLSGSGFDFGLAASGATSRTVATGATATFAAVLTPTPTLNQSVSLSCAGTPANSKCVLSPSSTALTGSQAITVTITTGVTPGRAIAPIAASLILLPAGWAFARRRKRLAALLAISFVAFGSICGCGAGRQLPANYFDAPAPVTPNGTYPVVLTATSAGLTRTVTFNLTVQ